MNQYSSKEAYWYRRHAVEAALKQFNATIPDLEIKRQELRDLASKLKDRSDRVRFRCTYLFREGQMLNVDDCHERGGYADTWYRSNHYNMEKVDEDEDEDQNEVPMPGEPVFVKFKPSSYGAICDNEFVECWHPKCQEYNKSHKSYNTPVIYLFCSGHAESNWTKSLHEHFIDGKPLDDPELQAAVEHVRSIVVENMNRTLDEQKLTMIRMLETEPYPSEVIEVECHSFLGTGDEEELGDNITYYVDRIACDRYEV